MGDSIVTVADVYEQATSIGKEIENIVNEHGEKVVDRLMPKVLYVLEQLEELVRIYSEDRQRIHELLVDRESMLIQTKRYEIIQRQFQEKLLYTESLLTKDKTELSIKIKSLEQDNYLLNNELDRRDNELVTIKRQESSASATSEDVEALVKLKAIIDAQRDTIRSLNNQLISRNEGLKANSSVYWTMLGQNIFKYIIVGVVLGCKFWSIVLNDVTIIEGSFE